MDYRKGLVARYGEEVLEELELVRSKGMGHKWADFEYAELAKEYRAKNKAMKLKRGIV